MSSDLPPGTRAGPATTRARKYKSISSLRPDFSTCAPNAPAELPGSEPGSPAHTTGTPNNLFHPGTPRTHAPSPLAIAGADNLAPHSPSPPSSNIISPTSGADPFYNTTPNPAPAVPAHTQPASGVHARRAAESTTVTKTIANMFAPQQSTSPYTSTTPASAIPAKLKWGVANSPVLSTGTSPVSSPRGRPMSTAPTGLTDDPGPSVPVCPSSPRSPSTRKPPSTGPGILGSAGGSLVLSGTGTPLGALSPTMSRTASLNRGGTRHSMSGVPSSASAQFTRQGSVSRNLSVSGGGLDPSRTTPATAAPSWFRHSTSDLPPEVLAASSAPVPAFATGGMSPMDTDPGTLGSMLGRSIPVKSIAQSMAASITRSVASARPNAPPRPMSAVPVSGAAAAAAAARGMGRLQSFKLANAAVLPGSPTQGGGTGNIWADDVGGADAPMSPRGVRGGAEISAPSFAPGQRLERVPSGRSFSLGGAPTPNQGGNTPNQAGNTPTTTEGGAAGIPSYQRQPSMSMCGTGPSGHTQTAPQQPIGVSGGYNNRFSSQPQVNIPAGALGGNTTPGTLSTRTSRQLVVVQANDQPTNPLPTDPTAYQPPLPSNGTRSSRSSRPQLTVVTNDLGPFAQTTVELSPQAITNASAAAAAVALLHSKALLLSSPPGAAVSSPHLHSPGMGSGSATPKDRSHAALLGSGMAVLQALQPTPQPAPQYDTSLPSPTQQQGQGQGNEYYTEIPIVSTKEAGVVRSQFTQLNGVLNTNTWERQLVNGFNASNAPTPDAAHFKRKAAIRTAQEARDKALR